MTSPGQTGNPEAIVPDEKDWTWVLAKPCPECNLDSSTVRIEDVPGLVRGALPRWRAALARPDAAVRADPQRWSVLEYGCHVRDVFRIFDERFTLMLLQHEPRFANWDQDATALTDRYGQQDPAVVAHELAEAGERIAVTIGVVGPDQYERRGLRSDGSEFTVATLAAYFWHDVHHHLVDVEA